eukprot:3869685-Rhodomonas_salina.2
MPATSRRLMALQEAVGGETVSYLPTRSLGDVLYCPSVWCYTFHQGMRCAVLTWRMVLRDAWY